MNRLQPYLFKDLLVAVTMVISGFYLLLQFLMLLLSLNIKRILKCSDKSAYDFLQKGCFWKGKKKKRVWYLKGPGLTSLRRRLLSAAKKETLHAMRSNIMLHFDRVRTLSMKTVKDTKIVGDHRQMLESIKKKDKESCRMLVEKHLSRYHIDEAEIRAAYPQYFKD